MSKDRFRDRFIKNHYITEYVIDDENKKVRVYYIDGSSNDYPLSSKVLSTIKDNMIHQYYEWKDLVKQVYIFNPIMLLYLTDRFKKQKFYLEHENVFKNRSVRKTLTDKRLSKKEIEQLNNSRRETHSYFNLATVDNYNLNTLKKVHKIVTKKNI